MNMCNTIPSLLERLYAELIEASAVYGYLVQNAPTEEARRMMQVNLMTVEKTKDAVAALYESICGTMPPFFGESLEELPDFATYPQALRYVFKEELQLIQGVKELYMLTEYCYRDPLTGIIIEHQLNAMRVLYLLHV